MYKISLKSSDPHVSLIAWFLHKIILKSYTSWLFICIGWCRRGLGRLRPILEPPPFPQKQAIKQNRKGKKECIIFLNFLLFMKLYLNMGIIPFPAITSKFYLCVWYDYSLKFTIIAKVRYFTRAEFQSLIE